MMNRILVISIVPPKNEGRLTRTLKILSKLYDLVVMSPFDNNLDCVTGNIQMISVCEKRPQGYVSQILYIISCMRKLKKEKINSSNIGAIYVANYLAIPVSLFIISMLKMRKMRIIYDAYEILFKDKSKGKTFREVIYLFFEKKIIKHSDLIIQTNQERAFLFQGYYQLAECPITLSNNNQEISVSGLSFHTIPQKQKVIYLCYIGFISKNRNLDLLIENLKEYKKIDFQLDIYGYGDDYLYLEEMIKKFALKNIYLHGKYNVSDIKKILSNTDIGFIHYPVNSYNNLYCEPNKLLEYAQNGIPMISYKHPKIEQLFSEYGIGVAKENITEAINEVVLQLKVYKENCLLYAQKIKKYQENEECKLLGAISRLW